MTQKRFIDFNEIADPRALIGHLAGVIQPGVIDGLRVVKGASGKLTIRAGHLFTADGVRVVEDADKIDHLTVPASSPGGHRFDAIVATYAYTNSYPPPVAGYGIVQGAPDASRPVLPELAADQILLGVGWRQQGGAAADYDLLIQSGAISRSRFPQCVVVGDGVNIQGNFNGANSIEAAIASLGPMGGEVRIIGEMPDTLKYAIVLPSNVRITGVNARIKADFADAVFKTAPISGADGDPHHGGNTRRFRSASANFTSVGNRDMLLVKDGLSKGVYHIRSVVDANTVETVEPLGGDDSAVSFKILATGIVISGVAIEAASSQSAIRLDGAAKCLVENCTILAGKLTLRDAYKCVVDNVDLTSSLPESIELDNVQFCDLRGLRAQPNAVTLGTICRDTAIDLSHASQQPETSGLAGNVSNNDWGFFASEFVSTQSDDMVESTVIRCAGKFHIPTGMQVRAIAPVGAANPAWCTATPTIGGGGACHEDGGKSGKGGGLSGTNDNSPGIAESSLRKVYTSCWPTLPAIAIGGQAGATGETSSVDGVSGGAGGVAGGLLIIEARGPIIIDGALGVSGIAGAAPGGANLDGRGPGGGGGGAGGILILKSDVLIQTGASSVISAAGGSGGNGANNAHANGKGGGGGGGGSGGMIFMIAPEIRLSGTINVNGGSGGVGGAGAAGAGNNGLAGAAGVSTQIRMNMGRWR